MEPVNKKKRRQDSSRLVLTEGVQEKAKRWLSQIEGEFNGMLSLKKNDLLNTILENLDDSLPLDLLEQIRSEKLTDKEKAKWIYQQFLKEQNSGSKLSLEELIKTATGSSKRRKRARKTANKKPQMGSNESSEPTLSNVEKASNII